MINVTTGKATVVEQWVGDSTREEQKAELARILDDCCEFDMVAYTHDLMVDGMYIVTGFTDPLFMVVYPATQENAQFDFNDIKEMVDWIYDRI